MTCCALQPAADAGSAGIGQRSWHTGCQGSANTPPGRRRHVDQPIAMFEDRPYKRTFYSAPQSVTSLLAAFMEPAITVITFLGANLYLDAFVGRPELVLCLLIFALTFPGRNRFRQNLLAASVDIVSSWM